ncbi:MAG TPA: DEAD/DEAH box helicase [Polyangiaceae bacterium]|jgi:ATP-dependent RNA helicase DeaD
MPTVDFAEQLGPALGAAIAAKGFTALTQVQKAVLDPALAGRDLRVTSQTGSGKTVAIGFVLRELAADPSPLRDKLAHPRALVIVPTRELAKQVVEELRWLYAPLSAKVAGVTGGASYRDELRALAAAPSVVVGTPGRLLDHLKRGSVVPNEVGAVVLDEADRMLDLGFREELEAILAMTPSERRTHLVSATFPRDVEALANSVQKTPARVEGTRLGAANADIEHVIHVVEPRQRLDAVINLLLANPEAQTLLFARTRADVAEIAERLADAGFAVNALSGEMDQRERDRALSAFRRADQRVLVATDVAARGIDVQDISLVIQLEPPTDPDSYTHRSGRTGRAGRKGRSIVIVTPSALQKTLILLKRAKVAARAVPVPSATEIRAASDQRLFDLLTREEAESGASEPLRALAERLAEREDKVRTIARLLSLARVLGPTEPREIRHLDTERRSRDDRGREREREREREPARASRGRVEREFSGREVRAQRDRAPAHGGDWVPFRISWGGQQGADARKLLAMVCRWGNVRGSDIGAIEIERDFSRLSVKGPVAAGFAEATSKPDARNPRVTIRPERDASSEVPHAAEAAEPRAQSPKTTEPREPRKPHKKFPERTSAEPRERKPHAPPAHEARERKPHAAPAHEARERKPHAPPAHEARERKPHGAAHEHSPKGGLPRDASRRRVVTSYPRDAKNSRDRARPHAPREAERAPETNAARDGATPPRRRRVVLR